MSEEESKETSVVGWSSLEWWRTWVSNHALVVWCDLAENYRSKEEALQAAVSDLNPRDRAHGRGLIEEELKRLPAPSLECFYSDKSPIYDKTSRPLRDKAHLRQQRERRKK